MPRVFIVDDDETHLELMRRKLERAGFDVETMTSPIGVTHKIQTERPDVVLLDVDIPAIRGDRLLELVRRKAHGATRFFYHSSMDEDELRRMAERDSMDGWFSKSEPLSRLIRRLVDDSEDGVDPKRSPAG